MASGDDFSLNDNNETVGEFEKGELMDLDCTSGGTGGTDDVPSVEKNVEQTADPLENAFGKIARPKTSFIHKEMKVERDASGIERRKCNWCGKRFKIDPKSHSTSSAKRHLLICEAKKRAMNLREKVRELAAHVILGHEYPFTLFEGEIFNKMLKMIYPWYKKISRHAVKNDCKVVYNGEKMKMKACMAKVNRISLTTDLWWSSEQKIGYMTVTGHYVDSKWQLHRRVLTFINFPPPHSGVTLARELIKVMEAWEIKARVVSITVDNASANDNCIRRLKEDFSGKKNLLLDGKLFHVRCCVHILNLLVKDGLDVIQYEIEKIRGGVKYLVSSERRCNEFNSIRKIKGLEGKIQVLDNNTRWNSTWLMLAIACYYKTCYPRYAEDDPTSANFVPTETEWDTVEEICQFLETFADATEVASGSYYPTVNLFITELWKVKSFLDENATRIDKPHMRLMAMEMQLKCNKCWKECDTLIALGAVLDPRYKMAFVKYTYPELCGPSAQVKLDTLQKDLDLIFKEYENVYKDKNATFQGQSSANGSERGATSRSGRRTKNFASFLSSQQFDNCKSDLDYYLEENIIMTDPNIKFSVLHWWRANEPKYPVLSKMEKDILTIPLSTVTSECTFNTAKRIIESIHESRHR